MLCKIERSAQLKPVINIRRLFSFRSAAVRLVGNSYPVSAHLCFPIEFTVGRTIHVPHNQLDLGQMCFSPTVTSFSDSLLYRTENMSLENGSPLFHLLKKTSTCASSSRHLFSRNPFRPAYLQHYSQAQGFKCLL